MGTDKKLLPAQDASVIYVGRAGAELVAKPGAIETLRGADLAL